MRKPLILLFGIAFFLGSCTKEPVESILERIAQKWVASAVYEGSVKVYQAGGASNLKPAYLVFRIELLPSGKVEFTDLDATRFKGVWELTDEKLVLKSLIPIPTGTDGSIEFNMDDLSETTLTLTRKTPSRKTGNSINQYILVKV